MKTPIIIWISLVSLLPASEPQKFQVTPATVPAGPEKVEAKQESALDREISEFRAKHDARNAVLINNAGGRAMDKEGRIKGSEGLGTLVTPPVEVIVISEAMVNDSVVELYTSIKKLPDFAHTVRILYANSAEGTTSSLLGYTIENADDSYAKLVKYDGKTPWLEWITKSFENDEKEHAAAGKQPTLEPEP